ncbi:MAG: FHA domain-containing protein [Alcaligenaceae bacterium]|nr:FHA domain-containing protein [Alcaligenaceae bacterium]
MKITVQNLSQSYHRSFALSSPGATFGRSPENQIVLADPSVSISLFQAAIKINESAQIEIRNLAATPILVGNQSLSVGQSLALQSDSEFICGDFKFKLEADSAQEAASINSHPKLLTNQPFRAPTVMPMPGSESMDFEKIAAEVAPYTTDRDMGRSSTTAAAEIIPEPLSLEHFGLASSSVTTETTPASTPELESRQAPNVQAQEQLTTDFELISEPQVAVELSPPSPEFEFANLELNPAPKTSSVDAEQADATVSRVAIVSQAEANPAPSTPIKADSDSGTSSIPESRTTAQLEVTGSIDIDSDKEIQTESEPTPEVLVAPQSVPVPVSESTPEAEAVPSIFDDLFAGSGVVPIGAEINYDVHPFEMGSATARNTDNPLGEMQGMALDDDLSKDPLERLSRDGIEHQQRDIFHDTRPSTLLHDTEQKSANTQSDLDHLDKILRELESLANSR